MASSVDGLASGSLENTQAMLEVFQQSPEFNRLEEYERNFLTRYHAAALKAPMTPEQLIQLTGIRDRSLGSYLGSDTVESTIQSMYATAIDIHYFINQRPYLLIHQPDTNCFYFFKNEHPEKTVNLDLQVLDVANRKWKRVEDLTSFIGTTLEDDDDVPNYDGLIKAKDLVVYFNQVSSIRDRIGVIHEQETTESQEPDVKYYHEEQTSGFCQLHAANAFLGYRAVLPSELQQFVTLKVGDFHQDAVEDLAQGPEAAAATETPELDFDIDNGIDQGMVINYLLELKNQNRLKVDISGLQKGSITIVDDTLVFQHTTEGSTPVDAEFLASKERIMIGTYVPAHAKTLRKNTDGSWTLIDSFSKTQPKYENIVEYLKAQAAEQQRVKGGNITLPIACL